MFIFIGLSNLTPLSVIFASNRLGIKNEFTEKNSGFLLLGGIVGRIGSTLD